MPGDAGTGGQGEKIVITGDVAGGGESNSAKGSGLGGVGGIVGFKNLNVGAKFKTHLVVVRGGHACDNGGRTHGRGDAVGPRKKVEAGDRVGNEMLDEESWEAFKRQPVYAGAEALLNGSY